MYKAPLTIGIEEEYQIIDPETRELTSYVMQLLNDGKVVLGSQVMPENLQSQIEVGSHICRNIEEARYEIARLRRSIFEIANNHGLEIIAAGTHPFSRWADQHVSEFDRYQMARDVYGIVSAIIAGVFTAANLLKKTSGALCVMVSTAR